MGVGRTWVGVDKDWKDRVCVGKDWEGVGNMHQVDKDWVGMGKDYMVWVKIGCCG